MEAASPSAPSKGPVTVVHETVENLAGPFKSEETPTPPHLAEKMPGWARSSSSSSSAAAALFDASVEMSYPCSTNTTAAATAAGTVSRLGGGHRRSFQIGERLAHLQTSRLPPQLNANAMAHIYDSCLTVADGHTHCDMAVASVPPSEVLKGSQGRGQGGHEEEEEEGGAESGHMMGGVLLSFIRKIAVLAPGVGSREGNSGDSGSPQRSPSSSSAKEYHHQQHQHQIMFVCFICYDSVPLMDRYVAAPSATSGTCPHTFCRSCVRAYLTSRTEEGLLQNNCPMIGAEGCELVYGEADMQALVSDDVLHKYRKFVTMRSNDNYRECPNDSCRKLLLGDIKAPTMTCEACSTTFCFVHSNAHPNETCVQYTRRTRKAERASKSAIRKISRPCPSCKAPTEKDGGCNHMRCSKCDHQWCWLCSRAYTDSHYAPTNLLGCPGSQFLDVHGFLGHYTSLLMWIPRLSLALFIFPVVLVLSVIAQCLWVPFSLCLCRSQLASGIKSRVYFTLPFLGALLGDTMSYLLCGRILAFMVLVLLLIPLQLVWLPVGLCLGALIIMLKTLKACRASELGGNCEIMAVSCFMMLGLWGLAVESLGFLSVFDAGGAEANGEGVDVGVQAAVAAEAAEHHI